MNTNQNSILEIERPDSQKDCLPLNELLAQSLRPANGQVLTTASTPAQLTTLIGTLVELGDTAPLVEFAGNPGGKPIPARRVCALGVSDIGREAVLMFAGGDPRQPIIMGLLQAAAPDFVAPESKPFNASVDGEEVTLSAKNEIVLRCGKASITLTRAGKIIIRGAYVLSRSSGVNRIKGGSVQIN